MSVDPTRAALVVQEYRFAQAPAAATSAAIKASYDKAGVIEVETNLDADGGQALADDLASLTTKRVHTFTQTVEAPIYPDDWIGGAPRYTLAFERHVSAGSSIYATIATKVSIFDGTTELTVRGS